MFDYITTHSIVLSVITFVILLLAIMVVLGKSMHENKPTKVHYFLFLLMIPLVLMPFIDSYSTSESIKENTKYFNDGTTIKCFGGLTPYLVSKDRGWSLDGMSFIKDDFIADATRCTLAETKK